MLFSDRTVITMVHGIVFSGAALAGLAAVLVTMMTLRRGSSVPTARQTRLLTVLISVATGALWLAVLAGTYGVFPAYRVTPPEGATDLTMYPRALLLANAHTAWLHTMAMETKEHVPWIAAMLATGAAFVTARDPAGMLRDAGLYRMLVAFLVISLILVCWAGLLGILVNKVAPLL